MSHDLDFEAWVARARGASVRGVLEGRGQWRKTMSGDRGVACPACGGNDRFAVNERKNMFTCRKSGAGGGALSLIAHLQGVDRLTGRDFLDACAEASGEDMPVRESAAESEADRAARMQARLEREEAMARQSAEAEASAALKQRYYRERERKRAWQLWRDAADWVGTPVEDYLRARDCLPGHDARLRYRREGELWSDGVLVHRGPMMLAAIEGPEMVGDKARFSGIHRTFIDLSNGPKFRAAVIDPKTGKMVDSKKVMGSQKGGSVLIAAARDANGELMPPRAMLAGEGIETCAAVERSLRESAPELLIGVEVRAFLNLGNWSGRAAGRLLHPTLTLTDKRGRVRAASIPNREPRWPDPETPCVRLPDSVRKLTWLMDADGDELIAENEVMRGAARYALAYPYVEISIARPDAGCDFHDMRTRLPKKNEALPLADDGACVL